jgi:rhodanese-related sulfurtransferase
MPVMPLLPVFPPKPRLPEITAAELKARLDGGEDLLLIDVREAGERAVSLISPSVHIPVGELARHLRLGPDGGAGHAGGMTRQQRVNRRRFFSDWR